MRIEADCIPVNWKNVGPTFCEIITFCKKVSLYCPEIIPGRYVTVIMPTKDYWSANLKFRADNY